MIGFSFDQKIITSENFTKHFIISLSAIKLGEEVSNLDWNKNIRKEFKFLLETQNISVTIKKHQDTEELDLVKREYINLNRNNIVSQTSSICGLNHSLTITEVFNLLNQEIDRTESIFKKEYIRKSIESVLKIKKPKIKTHSISEKVMLSERKKIDKRRKYTVSELNKYNPKLASRLKHYYSLNTSNSWINIINTLQLNCAQQKLILQKCNPIILQDEPCYSCVAQGFVLDKQIPKKYISQYNNKSVQKTHSHSYNILIELLEKIKKFIIKNDKVKTIEYNNNLEKLVSSFSVNNIVQRSFSIQYISACLIYFFALPIVYIIKEVLINVICITVSVLKTYYIGLQILLTANIIVSILIRNYIMPSISNFIINIFNNSFKN